MEENLSATFASRFWKKVHRASPDECWNWRASVCSGGYGKMGKAGKGSGLIGSHRASWIIHFGSIPEDKSVLHKCDNRLCVNPDHLFIGTQDENMKDCKFKGRYATGERHGLRKHPERCAKKQRHYRAILSCVDVAKIKTLCASGLKQRDVAAIYGITQPFVSSIVRGLHWSDRT